MVIEQKRRDREPTRAVSLEPLIKGEIPNPFTEHELEVIKLVRDGFATDQELADQLSRSVSTIEDRRDSIYTKVNDMYAGGGRGILNKAVALSILGGWIEPVAIDQLERSLTEDEFGYLYSRSFGESAEKARKNSGLSKQKFNKMRDNLIVELGFRNEAQLIGWGVSKARIGMLAARGLPSK